MQGDRGQRRAVVAVAPDQLGGQVLGLRGAAAVAGDQQAAAADEDVGQARAPGVQLVGVEQREGFEQGRDVRAAGQQRSGLGRAHEEDTSSSTGTPAGSRSS